MKVISGLGKIRLKNTAAAIGIFDGVHRGHQFLLKAMLKKARQLKAKSMVITFFPHPAHVFRPDIKLGYLMPLDHRLKLLEDMGIDVCVIIPFNKKFAVIEPQPFIKDILVKRLGVRAVFVGDDFRFGRNRSGDVGLFKDLAQDGGYDMHTIPALLQAGEPISSTRIRRLIGSGHLNEAKKLLGRPVALMGPVIKGRGRGRGLGYPTANVCYSADILPPNGVYAVRVAWKNKILPAVANLGLRPSFKEKKPKVHLEVHIFDFSQNLYGQTLEVQFLKKIRNEQTFASPQDLVCQIRKDAIRARAYLG